MTLETGKPSLADMLFYYDRLLPFKHVFQWLSHLPRATTDFTMREFAYEFRLGAYQRYNSYASADEFKAAVVAANPTRFEVGAVYSVNPKERKNLPKLAMKPVSKELVFDIDLTDYDSVRTCCQKTDICRKCWRFIHVASHIVTEALKEDFGFEHILWVFSGRRGAHCWVSDKRARELDESSRKAVVEYLDVLGKKLAMRKPFHPHVERSFNYLKDQFESIVLEEQNPWADSKGAEQLLSFIPDPALKSALRDKWSTPLLSRTKWQDINTVAEKVLKTNAQAAQLADAKREIVLVHTYPRLDVEVSKQMIHLLKSPFCIHPGTGNVCVPFDPHRSLSGGGGGVFDPTSAPHLGQLQSEAEAGAESSLRPYIEYFASFVARVAQAELRGVKRDALDF